MGWLVRMYQLFCLFLFIIHSQITSSPLSNFSIPLGPHDQSLALLQFKETFTMNNSASTICDLKGHSSYPRMKSWKEVTDCCSLDGVRCERETGHVISLDLRCWWLKGTFHPNSSLLQLRHLQWINLAFNDNFPSPFTFDMLVRNLNQLTNSSSR